MSNNSIYAKGLLKISPYLVGLVLSAKYSFSVFYDCYHFDKKIENIRTDVIDDNIYDSVNAINPLNIKKKFEYSPYREDYSSYLLDINYSFLNINFDELREINNDSCAWVTIDDTGISFPIVQGIDNNYYLEHDIYHEKSKMGAVFIDYRDKSLDNRTCDLSDVTVIYGHHIGKTKMFSPLLNYKKQDYYEGHPFGVIYTPDGYAYLVEFFSGVIISGEDDSILYTDDFENEEEWKSYYAEICNNSTFESDVDFAFGDKVIALVTCSYETNNSRYVLYGKVSKQYTNDNQFEIKKVLK